ncbi:family 1 glycosylhydrolase [Catellatospora chokoriensis]|uniref:family 1 glycosylhydrolase n=1 Tax=Catellatospora chokoriensis TaxID=310353 RepID=UPI001786D628|nr:family 1 glycosylhydrolase [Catellatospora chokoriensis]
MRRHPSYITENGASCRATVDPDGAVRDPRRIAYYDGYLRAAADAIGDGSTGAASSPGLLDNYACDRLDPCVSGGCASLVVGPMFQHW